MIKLKSLIRENSSDAIIEKFIASLPSFGLEYHSWSAGDPSVAVKWRGGVYPTITDAERLVKVALDRTDIFPHNGNVWVGDPSHPMLDGYVIQAIVTDPDHRGKGKAREMLKKVIAAADASGITLKLEPVPMKDFIKKKDQKLSQPQLTKWYAKYGFEKSPEANIMTRKPR
jgi:GNAT superfamily N-acetyltransferase